jgi:hypothetical protein
MGKVISLLGKIPYYSTWLILHEYGLKYSNCSFRSVEGLFIWSGLGACCLVGMECFNTVYGSWLAYSPDSGNRYLLLYAWVNSWSAHPPPPRDTPGNLPDRQFTGVGNLPFIYVHGGRVLEDPGDLTNGCPESHPQILRQQNLVSGTHVGTLIVFCALVVKVAWNLL